MLGMRLQIVAFFGIYLMDVVGATDMRAPKVLRDFRLLFDCLNTAADLVVQPHRAVEFGGLGFAQREFDRILRAASNCRT